MKYAILDSGGKQYIAREGETIEVDRLPLEIGKPVEFKDILLIADNGEVAVGTPTVKGASVKGRVLDHIKAAKIIVFKYIPKERYRRKQGHRQRYTRVSIEKITLKAAASKKAVPKEEATKAPAATAKPTASKKKETEKKTKAAAKSTTKKTSAAKSKSKKTEKSTTSKETSSKSSTAKTTSTKSSKAATKKTPSKSTTKSSSKKSSTTKK
jgi:large subunit ribosomal protein L21